jgi:DDE family transposase
VDIKTKEILALEVTDEKVHDSTMLNRFVSSVLDNSSKPHTTKVKSVLADGAYDSNNNFRYLEKKRIRPGIKVRKSSIISDRNSRLRNKEIRLQSKDYIKWKKKRKYGHRWMAEIAFSTIKRTFGEYVSATKFNKMVKEMMIKVSLYNLFRRL